MQYTRLPAALIPYFIESLVMVVCVVQSFLQMLECMHTRLQHFRFELNLIRMSNSLFALYILLVLKAQY